MRELMIEEKRILLNLLEACGGGLPIKAKRFRADFISLKDEIEQLVADGHIKFEDECYQVSLASMMQLDVEAAIGFRVNAETIWGALRIHYESELDAMVPVAALVEQCELDLPTVRVTLKYMLELSWWNGQNSNLEKAVEAVAPNEDVLTFGSFAAYYSHVTALRERSSQARSLGGRN